MSYKGATCIVLEISYIENLDLDYANINILLV